MTRGELDADQRRLVVLRGARHATYEEARALLAAVPDDVVFWAGGEFASRREVRRQLGRTWEAVVVDLHDGLDPDLLAQCHGFVLGGGTLIVCAPDEPPPQPHLAAWGHDVSEVTDHLWRRLFETFARFEVTSEAVRPSFHPVGSADQRHVIDVITRATEADDEPIIVLTADRGRGKSAALGLALHEVVGDVIVTAASEDAVCEVFEFAPAGRAAFVAAPHLLRDGPACDLLLVDEAAQLPVALLREITARYRVPLVFSTTTHGYEGTGRGFILRFVEQLRRGGRPLIELEMKTPIRWGAGDPVEQAIFDALLLDAEPAEPGGGEVQHRQLRRAELAADDTLLTEVFGLLVQAHYRTTPADLHRLLDAPNLAVHASFVEGHVVAATLVAREGGLDLATAEAVHDGARRLVGHALPDTFAAHLGYADAAQLDMLRSVRIATHPHLRRRGVASTLVEHVHAAYDVDLFGTVFGATAELIAFRRSLGYEVVRLSASRGDRTGVPSVVMIRPVSSAAHALFDELRADFARDVRAQLELFVADRSVRLDPDLELALTSELGPPTALDRVTRDRIVRHYAHGPRTYESAVIAIRAFLQTAQVEELPADLRTLVELRALDGRPWTAVAETASLSVPAAMRGLRRAIRALFDTPTAR